MLQGRIKTKSGLMLQPRKEPIFFSALMYRGVSFCLKVDFVYLLTIRLKLEIVPTRENHSQKDFCFFVGDRGPIS